MKLIKLSETHYIIVDDSEIKNGDYKYCPLDDVIKIHKQSRQYYDTNEFKIIHSTEPLEIIGVTDDGNHYITEYSQIRPLYLSEVEELLYGYNVENIAKDYTKEKYGKRKVDIYIHDAFKAGFYACKEVVKNNLFTVEDIEKAMIEGLTIEKFWERCCQSLLPKTDWEITFNEQGKIILLKK